MQADEEILRGLAAAKPEAFHRFFDEWFPRVYGFAQRRLASRLHAEAVTRAVLRRAVEDASTLDTGTSIAPWLLALVQREVAWVGRGTAP
jgi:DNA-directed RNA polymerase specialized sigma24 family protein